MITVNTVSRTITNRNLEASYTPDDFVNPEYFESRPNRQMNRTYVVLNGGFILGIVFAEHYGYTEQDALDEMCDRGKLDAFQVKDSELDDYEVDKDSEGNPEYSGLITLGNASEYFDIESLDVWIVPASQFSEDTALMTYDRVETYLKTQLDNAESVYKTLPVSIPNPKSGQVIEGTTTPYYEPETITNPEWLTTYRTIQDLEDTLTLIRLVSRR